MPDAILAIEASQAAASVAVRRAPGAPARELPVPAPERERDHLMAVIDAAFRAEGLSPSDLGLVAVSCGPGGFTGLRVACATAKALAESVGCRLVAVPSALSAARALATLGRLPDGPCTVVLASKGSDAWCSEITVSAAMPVERHAGLRDRLPDGAGPVVADEHLPAAWAAEATRRGLLRPAWSAEACLAVGEALAASGAMSDPLRLGPVYPRPPEAVALWEARHGGGNRVVGGTG